MKSSIAEMSKEAQHQRLHALFGEYMFLKEMCGEEDPFKNIHEIESMYRDNGVSDDF